MPSFLINSLGFRYSFCETSWCQPLSCFLCVSHLLVFPVRNLSLRMAGWSRSIWLNCNAHTAHFLYLLHIGRNLDLLLWCDYCRWCHNKHMCACISVELPLLLHLHTASVSCSFWGSLFWIFTVVVTNLHPYQLHVNKSWFFFPSRAIPRFIILLFSWWEPFWLAEDEFSMEFGSAFL